MLYKDRERIDGAVEGGLMKIARIFSKKSFFNTKLATSSVVIDFEGLITQSPI